MSLEKTILENYNEEESEKVLKYLMEKAEKFLNSEKIAILTTESIINSLFRYFYEESFSVYEFFQDEYYFNQIKEILKEEQLQTYNNYIKENFKNKILQMDLEEYKNTHKQSYNYIMLEKDRLKKLLQGDSNIKIINEEQWLEIKNEIWETIELLMDLEYSEYNEFYKVRDKILKLLINHTDRNEITYGAMENFKEEVINYLTGNNITEELKNKIKSILKKDEKIFNVLRDLKISDYRYLTN